MKSVFARRTVFVCQHAQDEPEPSLALVVVRAARLDMRRGGERCGPSCPVIRLSGGEAATLRLGRSAQQHGQVSGSVEALNMRSFEVRSCPSTSARKRWTRAQARGPFGVVAVDADGQARARHRWRDGLGPWRGGCLGAPPKAP